MKAIPQIPTATLSNLDDAYIEPYGKLYDFAPIGFYTLDRQGRICEINVKGAKFLAFPPEWLLSRPFVVFIAKQHTGRFLDLLRASTRHLEPQIAEVDLFVNGRARPVQISVSTSASGAVFHRLCVVDLTDVKRTEKLLQESLANWYALVHNAPDTILTLDARGKIFFVNKPLSGYSVPALINTRIVELLPRSERHKVKRCLEHAFRHNERMSCEVNGVEGDRDRWYQFSFGSPHGSNLSGLAGPTTTLVIREISESKRAEASLRTSGQQLRDFAARLEAVREEERTRVAREIHDELGQALTVLKLDLSWIESKSPGVKETRKKLQACIKQVDDTIECVRRISSELHPSILDNLGLIPAIEWQISQFRRRTGIRVRFSSNVEDLPLPMEDCVALFRVVQEALTNVMRHAKASGVKVRLTLDSEELQISIADNGIGMKENEEADLKSLGMTGMKERISRIGGEFEVSSESGKGTRLDIRVPVHYD